MAYRVNTSSTIREESSDARRPCAECWSSGFQWAQATDATRVASYNPWVFALLAGYGKDRGGRLNVPGSNRLSREEALGLYTQQQVGFRAKAEKKREHRSRQLADLVRSRTIIFPLPEEKIKSIESVLSVVGGKIVHATEDSPLTRRRRSPSYRSGRQPSTLAAMARRSMFAERHARAFRWQSSTRTAATAAAHARAPNFSPTSRPPVTLLWFLGIGL